MWLHKELLIDIISSICWFVEPHLKLPEQVLLNGQISDWLPAEQVRTKDLYENHYFFLFVLMIYQMI